MGPKPAQNLAQGKNRQNGSKKGGSLIISCQFIIITIITIWVLRGGKPEEEEDDSSVDDVEVQEAGKVAQRNVITPVPSPAGLTSY